MEQQSAPRPGSLGVLEKLSRSGSYFLATINNESFALNQYRIRTFELDKYYTAFLSSCYLGVTKPNRKIFSKALWITQRKGEECLFIDDREENVTAAQACGIRGIHLKDQQQLSNLLKEEGIKI
jgi:putative hydrolase of the HAD superfamily